MDWRWWLHTVALVGLWRDLASLVRQRGHAPPQGIAAAAPDPADVEPFQQYLLGWAQRYADYHNHKEAMAYTAVALYVAAAAWVITSDDLFEDVLRDLPRQIGFLALVLMAEIAGWGFVCWQLSRRREGAILEEAARNVGALILGPTPRARLELSTRPRVASVDDGVELPRILRDQINILEDREDPRLGRGEGWIHTILVLFGVGALARVAWEIVPRLCP